MNRNAVQIVDVESHGQEIWNQVLEQLLPEYGESIFEHWFKDMAFKELKDGVLIVTVKTKFVREWVVTNYLAKIRKFIAALDKSIERLDIQVCSDVVKRDIVESNPYFTGSDYAKVICNFTQTSKLNSHFTFENFVCGSSNQIAYNAAYNLIQCSEILQAKHMPRCLYIHGNVGMGKTHMLQAIANYMVSHHPEKKVSYLGVERFMNNYINAVRANQLLAFREHLRSSDILLLDDLQFICDKNSTQKEFTQTFDAIVEANKMIVIASDRPPYQLPLEARIKSRLVSSISVEIQNPDFDLRLKILQSKAKLLNTEIDPKIMNFIADKISNSIRELEGALYMVLSHCSFAGIAITLENVKSLLRDAIVAFSVSQPSITAILDAVADFYNMNKSDILTKHRFGKSVLARQVVAYLAKDMTSCSLQEIGKKLGGRDHATVIYSIKQIERKISDNSSVAQDILRIKETLRGNSVNDSVAYGI